MATIKNVRKEIRSLLAAKFNVIPYGSLALLDLDNVFIGEYQYTRDFLTTNQYSVMLMQDVHMVLPYNIIEGEPEILDTKQEEIIELVFNGISSEIRMHVNAGQLMIDENGNYDLMLTLVLEFED